jgi:hypothetical protein
MKKYRYFTFRNFVALNVIEGDMHFVDPMSFWKQAKVLEIKQAALEGRPVESGLTFPLSDADIRILRVRITPVAFEKSLQELLLLMEDGLIVIGNSDSPEKTSYGHTAINAHEGSINDAIQAIRDDFAKDKDGWFEWNWMIQATTKGWEWANQQVAQMDNAEYHREQADFFEEDDS